MPLLKFPENYFEGEVREGFYVEPLMKRAWAAQLEVLEHVKIVCKRHNIKFFADFGTMLGAARHKGFIPWDDDMDITMLREDLMRFIRYAKEELPESYLVINCYDYPEYINTVIVRLVNSNAIRLDEEFLNEYHGFPFACGLDIFPLDYIPRDETEREMQRNLLSIVRGTLEAHLPDSEATDEQKEYLFSQVQELTGQAIDRSGNIIQQLSKLLDSISAMFEEKDADHVGIAYRMTYLPDSIVLHRKEVYEKAVDMPFEVTTIPTPILSDEYLTDEFSENYMTPKIYPAHDYPFYGDQMKQLKDFLAKNGSSLEAIGLPDIEIEDFMAHKRES